MKDISYFITEAIVNRDLAKSDIISSKLYVLAFTDGYIYDYFKHSDIDYTDLNKNGIVIPRIYILLREYRHLFIGTRSQMIQLNNDFNIKCKPEHISIAETPGNRRIKMLFYVKPEFDKEYFLDIVDKNNITQILNSMECANTDDIVKCGFVLSKRFS